MVPAGHVPHNSVVYILRAPVRMAHTLRRASRARVWHGERSEQETSWAVTAPSRTSGASAAPADSLAANDAADAELNRHRWLILLGLITAAIMEVLDTTI